MVTKSIGHNQFEAAGLHPENAGVLSPGFVMTIPINPAKIPKYSKKPDM
jgi:hypothetical protein